MRSMPAATRRGRPLPSLVLGTVIVSAASPATAFDFFGLFGTSEVAPAASPNAIAYTVTFEGAEDSDLRRALEASSTLYRLRQEPPPDGDGIARRIEADLPRLTDVL